jgi:hypothetical protein
MNPNNLFSGYSYKEKVRFVSIREQIQEEERIDRAIQTKRKDYLFG